MDGERDRPAPRSVPSAAPIGHRQDLTADFDAFVAARGAALVRTAWALLKDPHDAEDVVQDVLAKAFVHWGTVQRAGNPDAYVRRMLVNACTSFWRRAVRRERAVDTADLIADLRERWSTRDCAAATAERDLVLALLRGLPAKQRAVLVLRHYDDLDDAAVADALGISTEAVRANAHRGVAKLRALLADLPADVTTDATTGGTR